MSSSLAWLMPLVDDEKSITVGTWRAISAASWSGPRRQRVVRARDLLTGPARRGDQIGVERNRLDPPERLPLDRALLGRGGLLRQLPRLGQQRGEDAGIEMPLVEQQRRLAGDRGHDAGLRVGPARGRHAAVPDRRVAHREREARRGEERVAAMRHRRRAGMRGLTAEDHAVALDADRAEDRPDGQAEPLEHRALLDVQLEVGAHVSQAAARGRRAVELDAVLGDDVLEAHRRSRP